MIYFLSTFKAIASLFTIGLLGFFITKRKILPEKLLDAISTLALDFALPCLVFYKVITNFTLKGDFWFLLPLYWVVFTVIAIGLAFLSAFLINTKYQGEFRLSMTFQNAIFIPIITVTSIWKDDATFLVYIFLFTLLYPAFFFNFYILFFKKVKKVKPDWTKVFNPVFIATILALIIKACGLEQFIPSFILLGISMVSNITIPLIMIVVGGIIYIDLKDSGKLDWKEMGKFILVKNFVFPAIAIVILMWLKLPTTTLFLNQFHRLMLIQ